MKETPLPLMVWAMITVGFSEPALAWACAKARFQRVRVVAVRLDDVPAEGTATYPRTGARARVFSQKSRLCILLWSTTATR